MFPFQPRQATLRNQAVECVMRCTLRILQFSYGYVDLVIYYKIIDSIKLINSLIKKYCGFAKNFDILRPFKKSTNWYRGRPMCEVGWTNWSWSHHTLPFEFLEFWVAKHKKTFHWNLDFFTGYCVAVNIFHKNGRHF